MATLGCTECNRWTLQGDGSQRICENCSSSGGVKRKYITVEEFNKKAKLIESKWRELTVDDVYYINTIHERVVKGQTSKYAVLDNIVSGLRTTAWLPSLIARDLEAYNVEKTPTYIQPLGMKANKDGTRDYYDFVIIADEDGNIPDDDDDDTNKPRRYLSLDQFKAKAKLVRNILKWRDLSIGETYYINAVRERHMAKYIELENINNGGRSVVWLPSLITSVLEGYDLNIPTYIRPMGLKQTIDGARTYHDFLIVTDGGKE